MLSIALTAIGILSFGTTMFFSGVSAICLKETTEGMPRRRSPESSDYRVWAMTATSAVVSLAALLFR